MCALHSATSPVRVMDELETFIEFWCGPRRPEYGVPQEALRKLSLPGPLRRLYAFAGRWPPVNEDYDYVGHIFGVQDALVSLENLQYLDDGKVIFLWENQGNWKCAALAEGDDPPVWVDDWIEGTGKWLPIADSLTRFLASYCLQELFFGSKVRISDSRMQEIFQAEPQFVAPVWTEHSYPGEREFDFCLWRDAILVWKGWGFAANSTAGVEFLMAHLGEITEVRVDLGQWGLNIRADGSGEIGVSNAYHATARVPARTFDFPVVRDRLLAASDGDRGTANAPRVFFIRSGQTSFRGQRVHDTRLAVELYNRALRGAVDRQSGFERQLKDQPPIGISGS